MHVEEAGGHAASSTPVTEPTVQTVRAQGRSTPSPKETHYTAQSRLPSPDSFLSTRHRDTLTNPETSVN